MTTFHSYPRLATTFVIFLGLALAAWRTASPCDLPKTPPCSGCCACGCGNQASNAGGARLGGDPTSVAPVRYFNGDIRMAEDDFGGGAASAGLWGHTRVYCNAVPTDASHNNGNRWLVQQWPYVMREDATINVVFDPLKAYWFDPSGGGYAARYGAKQTLVHDTASHVYRMTEPDGTFWEFYDFTQATLPEGLFYRRVSPGGQTVQVTSCNGAQILQLQLSNSGASTPFERYDYSYGAVSGTSPQLTSAKLSRCNTTGGTLAAVRQVSYTYYSPGSTCGLAGDLRSATSYTLNSSGGTVGSGDTYYYRYYTASGSGGFPHGLKSAFRPQAFNNLMLSNTGTTNPDSLADTAVAPYACYYFEYTDPTHPSTVTKEAVFGGSQIYTFAYTDGTGTDANPNAWAMKTVEQEMSTTSGTAAVYTNTVYTNSIGQVLLTDLQDSNSNHWRTYRCYDPANRLLLTAEPSAVAGYGLNAGNWDGYSPTAGSAGLVHETNYYATTTGSESIAGGAAGYAAYELVRTAGSSLVPSYSGSADTVPNLTVSGSTAAILSYSQYFAHAGADASGGTQTIFPTARRTTFSDPSGTSSSAITYSYSYQWNPITVSGGTAASLQARQQTTTLPAISAAQNGPGGMGVMRTEWYNSLGQLTWQMDERGRVTYSNHDPITGSLTQAILDISSSAASSLSPPSGWTIPSDGLSVTTSYQFDSLGRVNQVLGPPHYNDQGNSIRTANWTVYDDPNHIVYSAAGYQVSGGTSQRRSIRSRSSSTMPRAACLPRSKPQAARQASSPTPCCR